MRTLSCLLLSLSLATPALAARSARPAKTARTSRSKPRAAATAALVMPEAKAQLKVDMTYGRAPLYGLPSLTIPEVYEHEVEQFRWAHSRPVDTMPGARDVTGNEFANDNARLLTRAIKVRAAIDDATKDVTDPVQRARMTEVYGSVYLHWVAMSPAQRRTAENTVRRMGVWREAELVSHVDDKGFLQKALGR